MKNLIPLFFISLYFIGHLSAKSDSIILALEDTLQMQMDSLDIAKTLFDMGRQYETLGEYNNALTEYTKTLRIRIDSLGEEHTDVAQTYHNLGRVYIKLHDYAKALVLTKKALKIKKDNNFGNTANSYHNLGNIYTHFGNYKEALEVNTKVLNMRIDNHGKDHYVVAYSCMNLGLTNYNMGEYEKSLSYYNRASTILKNQNWEYLLDFGIIDNNKGNVYYRKGKYDESLKLYKQALDFRSKELPDNHLLLTSSYNNIAECYNSLGRYDEALNMHEKSLNIRKKRLPDSSPHVIDSYRNIAKTHQALNKHKIADSLWHIAISQSLKRLNDTYLFLPDNQRLEYAKTFKDVYNGFYSFAAEYENEDTKKLAAYLLLNTKSLALDYSISVRELINNIDDKELKNLHNELNTINRNISQAELMTKEQLTEKNWNLTDLQNQQENLTRQLLKNKTLREKLYKTSVTWEDTQSRLKSDEAIVDFVRFYEESDSRWMYYAMLTRKDMSAPEFIRITDEEAIDSFLQTNKTSGRPDYIQNNKNLQALYQRVWQPLKSHLKGIKTVHLSPSGLLHRIDFGVLQNENENYLADHFEFHYYTTMRDFAKKTKTNWLSSILTWLSEIFNGEKHKNLLLFGDIAYDSSFENEKSDTIYAIAAVRSGFDPLPYTREEIREIGQINEEEGGTFIKMTGNDATEDTLKHHAANFSPDIIHFATHGEYLARLDTIETDMEHRLQTSGNPLQRSIIALSGANNTWTSKEYIPRSDSDGILTAYEVSHLDLSKTKLVVLSACETALGDIHDTEGVLGLQSALKLAGVQHVIVSLWKVDDEATKDLMIAFYENLFIEKQDAPTALLYAKDEMRKKTKAKPTDWAGFILIE